MKERWNKTKLLDICTIQYGYAFDSKCFCDDSNYPQLIRIRDVVRGYSDTFYKGTIPDGYYVKKGELLIGMDGEFKIAPWKSEDALLNQRVCKITAKKEFSIDGFLYYCMQNVLKAIEEDTPFVTVKHLSAKRLNSVILEVPPISEQLSIVSELDTLSSIISKHKQLAEEYDLLEQSIFYEMFGNPLTNEKKWVVKEFHELGNIERGAGISKKDFVENGLPCIHYGQLHTTFGALTNSHITCIPENLLPRYKYAHHGDVIMAITSEDVEGSCKSTAWMGNYDVVVGSDAAIFHHSQNGIFISFYTKTMAFYYEKAKYANGFKVTHISTKEIEKIPIPVPPLSLQNLFAEKVEFIESLKAKNAQAQKEAELLFAERMNFYFGE